MEIPVRSKGVVVAYALIDDDQAHLAAHRWTLDADGYVRARPKHGGVSLIMHRAIMGLRKGDPLQVDHVSGDKLDNRRSNLRVCTKAQNMQNLPPKHGVRGVSFHGGGRKNPWRAEARLERRRYYLGHYATEEEAAAVMREWYAEHMPFSNPERHRAPA